MLQVLYKKIAPWIGNKPYFKEFYLAGIVAGNLWGKQGLGDMMTGIRGCLEWTACWSGSIRRLTQGPVWRNRCTTALSLAVWRSGNDFLSVGIRRLWYPLSGIFSPVQVPGNISQRIFCHKTRFSWLIGFRYHFFGVRKPPVFGFKMVSGMRFSEPWMGYFPPDFVFSRLILSQIVSVKIWWIHNFDFPIYRYNERQLKF